jgi:electron transfer flavoprotein beta subunit
MSELHTVVCMKVVPKPEEIRVDSKTMRLERENARSEINPPDMNALEMALELKDRYGGRVDILSMGPPFFEGPLRVCLSMGADHIYLLSDFEFGGADTLATTYTLSMGIKKIKGVNLVFCGEESSDGATGQVPPGLAEWLDFNQITVVEEVDVDIQKNIIEGKRGIKGGYEVLEVPFPAVISVVTASNEPRFMDYRIKDWAFEKEQMTVWGIEDIRINKNLIGIPGSPTVVSGLEQAPSQERKRIFLKGTPNEIAEKLVKILEEDR